MLTDAAPAFLCSYQCGADDSYLPPGLPPRIVTDWQRVYQTSSTPSISKLPWYNVLGNHGAL